MKDDTVSRMKGLAIIAVVMGHCAPTQNMEAWVNQWHLAVFFFVAGFCFNEKYVTTPRDYVLKSLKSQYWSYLKTGLFFLILHNLFYYVYINDHPYLLADYGKEIFNLSQKLTSMEPLIGAMWFCPALLICSLLMIGVKVAIHKYPPPHT